MKLFQIQTAHLTFLPMDLLLMLRLLKSQGLFICSFIHSFIHSANVYCQALVSLFFFYLTGTVLSRAVNKAAPLASLGFVPLCPVLTQKEVYVLERNIFFFWLFTFCQVNNLHNRTLCTENPRACVVVHSECFLYKQLSGPRKPDRPRPPLVCKMSNLQRRLGGYRFCLPYLYCQERLFLTSQTVKWFRVMVRIWNTGQEFYWTLICGFYLSVTLFSYM